MSTSRRFDAAIVALIGVGLGVRMWAVSSRPAPALWLGDAVVYREIVAGLLQGQWSSAAWLWTPGYPLVSLPLAALLGAESGLIWTSMVLGALAPLVLFFIAPHSASPATPKCASAAIALMPEAIWASSQPLSDATGMFLVTLALVAVVTAARREGFAFAVSAGAAAGLAILTRPEVVVLVAGVALFTFEPWKRASVAKACAFGGAVVAVIAPYVVGLFLASGAWGLSLKREYNEYKHFVYSQHVDYYDKRVAWEEIDAKLRTHDGEWDARKIAALKPPASPPGTLRAAGRRALIGVKNMAPTSAIFFAVGLVGLVWPRRASGALALRAARSSLLGYLPLPFAVAPFSRFLLPLVPAAAWGWGSLVTALAKRTGHHRVLGSALAVAAAAVCLGAVVPRIHESGFEVYRVEVRVLIREGRLDEAERMMRAWIHEFDEKWEAHAQLAEILGALSRWDDAIGSFERALELGATRDAVSFNIGVTHLRAGRPQEARPWLEAAARSENPERRSRALRLLDPHD